MPDLTLVFDVPPDVGLGRAKAKGAGGDRIEREALEFHMKVRQGFLKLAGSLAEQGRIVLVNASPPRTKDEIHAEVVAHISKRLWMGDGDPLQVEEEDGNG